jgi:site-specific DNA-methyltransferase (adenine-specific)
MDHLRPSGRLALRSYEKWAEDASASGDKRADGELVPGLYGSWSRCNSERMDVVKPTRAISCEVRQADCLKFLAELPSGSVDAIVTDPAYSGMNQHLDLGRGRIVGEYGAAGNGRWFPEFHDDPETFEAFLLECYRVLAPDRHIYVMFDSFSLLSLGAVMRRVFAVKGLIVWDKVNIGMGHYFRRRHEMVVFASKGRRILSRRDLPDVWAIKRIHNAAYPTQKPVELFTRMLTGSVEPGMVVCDPFVGSGSSAVAALRAGCHFIGADVEARAVEMTQQRWDAVEAGGEDPLEAKKAR